MVFGINFFICTQITRRIKISIKLIKFVRLSLPVCVVLSMFGIYSIFLFFCAAGGSFNSLRSLVGNGIIVVVASLLAMETGCN